MIGRKTGFAVFIMLLALVLLPARASAQWSNCSGEGGTCEMSGPGHHLLRAGADDSFFYIETDGNVTRVPCNTDVFGDAAYKKDKNCQYIALSPLDPAIQWTICATEGSFCRIQQHRATSRQICVALRPGTCRVPHRIDLLSLRQRLFL